MLSGTPVVNSPLDLYPAVNRLLPRAIAIPDETGELRRMQQADFANHYCTFRTVRIAGGRTVQVPHGAQNVAELRARLAPYMSRLRRDEVLDLPPIAINDTALSVETGDALAAAMAELPEGLQQTLTEADDDELLSLLRQHAAALTTLRRLIGTLKAPAAAEHLLQRLDGGEDRIIGFFHHRAVGDLMLDHLRRANVTAAMVRGDTPSAVRTRAIDALTDGQLAVLLLQNETGSLGLNLQACRRCVIIEPSWTDATTQQAIGRIRCAGQIRHCFVEFLMIADLLDEHVVGVARRKAALAAELIETPVKETA